MANVNLVILAGYLGKAAEVITFERGGKKATFNIAIDEYNGKDAQGNAQYKSTWFEVNVFGETVDYVERYITKGTNVMIQGRLAVREWEKDGQRYSKQYIIASRINTLSRAKEDVGGQLPTQPNKTQQTQNSPQITEMPPIPTDLFNGVPTGTEADLPF